MKSAKLRNFRIPAGDSRYTFSRSSGGRIFHSSASRMTTDPGCRSLACMAASVWDVDCSSKYRPRLQFFQEFYIVTTDRKFVYIVTMSLLPSQPKALKTDRLQASFSLATKSHSVEKM